MRRKVVFQAITWIFYLFIIVLCLERIKKTEKNKNLFVSTSELIHLFITTRRTTDGGQGVYVEQQQHRKNARQQNENLQY